MKFPFIPFVDVKIFQSWQQHSFRLNNLKKKFFFRVEKSKFYERLIRFSDRKPRWITITTVH